MSESRGTLERPNTSVFFPPITDVMPWYETLNGLSEYLTLDGLGSWLSKKIFGSRGDNAQAFFSERNAVKVGMVIGGPAGAAIAADAKARAERSREENQRFEASAAARVDPGKLADVLEGKKPAKPENISKDLILHAVQSNAFKQGMGIDAYMADPKFAAKAVKDALETIKRGKQDLRLQLEENKKEQDILANEIMQVLTQGRLAPKPGAMPLEEIQHIQATATVEVMQAENIPINKPNVDKVIPEVHNEWVRQQRNALRAAKAEEKLARSTLRNYEIAEKVTQGVSFRAKK
jgi:hypothetical protein